jgi:hypothetical protein
MSEKRTNWKERALKAEKALEEARYQVSQTILFDMGDLGYRIFKKRWHSLKDALAYETRPALPEQQDGSGVGADH